MKFNIFKGNSGNNYNRWNITTEAKSETGQIQEELWCIVWWRAKESWKILWLWGVYKLEKVFKNRKNSRAIILQSW